MSVDLSPRDCSSFTCGPEEGKNRGDGERGEGRGLRKEGVMEREGRGES